MLNLHKFRHNFRHTLNLLCPWNNGVEDTENILLHCHPYDGYRRDPLDSANSTLQLQHLPDLSNGILLEAILYGDERLSTESNSEVLKVKAPLSFIK